VLAFLAKNSLIDTIILYYYGSSRLKPAASRRNGYQSPVIIIDINQYLFTGSDWLFMARFAPNNLVIGHRFSFLLYQF
jgi:hypothetical protein